MLDFARKYLNEKREIKKNEPLYEKYKEFTMVPKEEYLECLTLVSKINNIKGCIVECGVWRGGMSAGMANIMGNERAYYLFDSFEGLPPAKEIDGAAALAWQKDVNSPSYYANCKAEMEWAEKAMKKSGVPKYELVKGWFDKTIPGYKFNSEIAVLRLDGDWYDSTMVCLENLFPKVIKGGLIILDDYYLWDGCTKAVHDYLSGNSLPARICQYNNGHIHYIVKP